MRPKIVTMIAIITLMLSIAVVSLQAITMAPSEVKDACHQYCAKKHDKRVNYLICFDGCIVGAGL